MFKTSQKKLKAAQRPRKNQFPSKELAIIANVCDTFDCDNGICNVEIPCKGIDFGKRIVKIFIERPDSADFTTPTSLQTQADWAARLAIDCTGANASQRIVAIGDVHDGIKPKSEVQTEPGPYGGDEETERKQSVTFNIKRWDLALFDSVNYLRCRDMFKMRYLTDTGYLFGGPGGFKNVSIMWGDLEHPGNGGGRVLSQNVMTWLQSDQSKPVYAPFLATMTN